MRNLNMVELVVKIVEGSRGCVARAITLVESTRSERRVQAHELLQLINSYIGRAFCIGISGAPGAGKSIFVNATGVKLIEEHNHQVAVLVVDPSLAHTGGSILGDRTRMGDLAMREEAFIRPSPSVGHLGGMAYVIRESMLVLETVGYGVVLVETTGVGQSEVAVTDMVDTSLFLYVVRIGDQLQGTKHGILELADVISITKADGDNEGETRVLVHEFSIVMKLIPSDESRRHPPMLTCPSYTGADMDEVWGAVTKHHADLEKAGELVSRRRLQQRAWLWNMAEQEITQSPRTSPKVREIAACAKAGLAAERASAAGGASDILEAFVHTFRHPPHEPAGE